MKDRILLGVAVVVASLHPAWAMNAASVALLHTAFGAPPFCDTCSLSSWVEFLGNAAAKSSDEEAARRGRTALGVVYQQQGKMDEAVEQWRVAKSAPFWERMSAASQSHSLEATIAFRQRAIKVAPYRMENYFILAEFYWPGLDRAADALETYRQVIAVSAPNSFDRYYAQGWLARLSGQWNDALASFDAASDVYPERTDVLRLAALAAKQIGAYDTAIAYLQRALAHDVPGGWLAAWTYVDLGDIYRDTDQEAKAVDCYLKAGRMQPQNPSAVGRVLDLAATFERRGQLAEARELYTGVLEIDPSNTVAAGGRYRLR